MYGAIGIGVIMISLGLILNIINRFRRGDIIGGVLDKFGLVGLLFYWGHIAPLDTWCSYPIMGAHERIDHSVSRGTHCRLVPQRTVRAFHQTQNKWREGSEQWVKAPVMESCVGEAILSYLANTISFVRLAAYAMSHAALLFAAFMVSAQVRDFPFVGSAFSLLVIIFGNIIAILL